MTSALLQVPSAHVSLLDEAGDLAEGPGTRTLAAPALGSGYEACCLRAIRNAQPAASDDAPSEPNDAEGIPPGGVRVRHFGAADAGPRGSGAEATGAHLCMPLTVAGRVVGVLSATDAAGRSWSPRERELLGDLAGLASAALSGRLARVGEPAEKASSTSAESRATSPGEGEPRGTRSAAIHREEAAREGAAEGRRADRGPGETVPREAAPSTDAAPFDWAAVLDAILSVSRTVVFDFDVRSNRGKVAGACREVLGWSAEELAGSLEKWLERVHPEDRDALRVTQAEHIAARVPTRVEYRFLRGDGTYVPIRLDANVIAGPGGEVVRTVGLLSDVTESRLTSEERDRLFALSNDILAIVGFDGSIRRVSPVISRLLGWASKDLEGRQIAEYVHPSDHRVLAQLLVRESVADAPHRVRLRQRHRDGSFRWFEWSVTSVLDRGLIYGVGRDVTEQLEHERELEEARLAAVAADEAKTAFLASMSHEIRTPLAAILGSAEMLGEPDLSAVERDVCIESSRRNGRHLLALIDDLLDLSRIERGAIPLTPGPCSPRRLVSDAVEVLAPRAREKGIALRWSAVEPLPLEIWSDPIRVQQILLNLIGNAVKFTERGGVAVQLRVTPAAGRPGADRLEIAVRDTGIGIAGEQQREIFEPFAQASREVAEKFGGTGLGLAISRRLARMLGGDLAVESELAVGSTFTLALPIEPSARGATSPGAPGRPSTRSLADA